jgi:hypothetical protein
MSLASHLAELERKHRALDQAISNELQHPQQDTAKVTILKRQKLNLKDEITKLKTEMATKTIH